MAFISSTHTKTVSAAGATNCCGRLWKMPFTCSSTNSKASSTNAWRLFGTPAVAPRTTHQRKPSAEDAQHHRGDERVDVERPEAALADRLGEERQVVLDVIGGVEFCFGGHR